MEITKSPRTDRHTRVPRNWSIEGVRVGTLVSVGARDGAKVTYAEHTGSPLAARTTTPVARSDEGRPVVLIFENGDPGLPIITGFVLGAGEATRPTTVLARAGSKVIEIEAGRELVLRCGKSSVTLHADGEIVIRGERILSRASRTNKVKGATVQLN
jgi:hypothetical protein